MKHLWLKYYNVYINHDPVMTLTQFMARSTWVDHVFKWGKVLKCHLKGKASKKLANGQNIDYSENKEENGPRASSAPTLGLNTIIFKHSYWYMQQISGERLQDHWSSCYIMPSNHFRLLSKANRTTFLPSTHPTAYTHMDTCIVMGTFLQLKKTTDDLLLMS